jgi:hypothetical protein
VFLASDPVARFETAAGGGRTEAVDQQELPDRLCRAVVEVLDVEAAAISVCLGPDLAVPIGASDLDATTAEALQFTYREGPCLQVYTHRKPVLIPNLSSPDSPAWSRWPTYTADLRRRTDYHGVFVYPLVVNDAAMGALSLYRRTPGAPAAPGAIAPIAARIADRLSADLFTGTADEPFPPWLNGMTSHRRHQVWIAQGKIVQANRLTPGQAIDLLRAQAFTADRLLDDLADDIATGRLPVPILHADQ